MFVEAITTDQDILNAHIRNSLKVNPDYKVFESDKGVELFKQKVISHKRCYETIKDYEGPYIKILNGGQKVREI